MSITFSKAIDDFRTTAPSGRPVGSTTLELDDGAGAELGPLPANRIYRVTCFINPDTLDEEILTTLIATGISGDTLTGVSASPGYADITLPNGTTIDIRVTAKDISDLQESIEAIQVDIGGINTELDTLAVDAEVVHKTTDETIHDSKTFTSPIVGTITGSITTSQVTGLNAALALKAPLASPPLTGTPTAPTAAHGTNTTQIATCSFVLDHVVAGPQGPPGPPGASNAVYTNEWRWRPSAVGDPGNGRVTIDTSNWPTATKLFVSDVTADGFDFHGHLIKIGDDLYIQEKANANNWAKYDVTGVTDMVTHMVYDIAFIEYGNGVPPSTNTVMALSVLTEGATASLWLNGDGPPTIATGGRDGDYYLDNNNGDVYFMQDGVWTKTTTLEGKPAGAPNSIQFNNAGDFGGFGSWVDYNLTLPGWLSVGDGTTPNQAIILTSHENPQILINSGSVRSKLQNIDGGGYAWVGTETNHAFLIIANGNIVASFGTSGYSSIPGNLTVDGALYAPTASAGTSTTQVATTAFVTAAVSASSTPPGGASGSVQFNNSGVFGGIGNWNGTSFTLDGHIVSSSTTNAGLSLQVSGPGNPYLRATSTDASGVAVKLQAIGSAFGMVGTESNHPFSFIVNNTSVAGFDIYGRLNAYNGLSTSQYGSGNFDTLNSVAHATGVNANPTAINATLNNNPSADQSVGSGFAILSIYNKQGPNNITGFDQGTFFGIADVHAGTITALDNIVSRVGVQGGNITTAVHFKADNSYSSAGTIGTRIGLQVNDLSYPCETQYGILVHALTSGTANYAIYTHGWNPSRFGGDVSVGGGLAVTSDASVTGELAVNGQVRAGTGIGYAESNLRAGSIEFQTYSPNNAWIAENAYLGATTYLYRANGLANRIWFVNGFTRFERAVAGNAGDPLTWLSSMVIDPSGDVTVLGNTTINGNVTVSGGVTASGAWITGVVHTTGEETVGGVKYFTDDLYIQKGASYAFFRLAGGSNEMLQIGAVYANVTAASIGVGGANPALGAHIVTYANGTILFQGLGVNHGQFDTDGILKANAWLKLGTAGGYDARIVSNLPHGNFHAIEANDGAAYYDAFGGHVFRNHDAVTLLRIEANGYAYFGDHIYNYSTNPIGVRCWLESPSNPSFQATSNEVSGCAVSLAAIGPYYGRVGTGTNHDFIIMANGTNVATFSPNGTVTVPRLDITSNSFNTPLHITGSYGGGYAGMGLIEFYNSASDSGTQKVAQIFGGLGDNKNVGTLRFGVKKSPGDSDVTTMFTLYESGFIDVIHSIHSYSATDSNLAHYIDCPGNPLFKATSLDASGSEVILQAVGPYYGIIGTTTNHSLIVRTNNAETARFDPGGDFSVKRHITAGDGTIGDIRIAVDSPGNSHFIVVSGAVVSKLQNIEGGGYAQVGTQSNHGFNIITNNTVKATFESGGGLHNYGFFTTTGPIYARGSWIRMQGSTSTAGDQDMGHIKSEWGGGDNTHETRKGEVVIYTDGVGGAHEAIRCKDVGSGAYVFMNGGFVSASNSFISSYFWLGNTSIGSSIRSQGTRANVFWLENPVDGATYFDAYGGWKWRDTTAGIPVASLTPGGNLHLHTGELVIESGRITVPGSGFNSSIKAGTLEIQSYAINNGWVGENVYYDSVNYRYRNNGWASKFHFGGSACWIDVSAEPGGVAGTAGSAVTWKTVLNANLNVVQVQTKLELGNLGQGAEIKSLGTHGNYFYVEYVDGAAYLDTYNGLIVRNLTTYAPILTALPTGDVTVGRDLTVNRNILTLGSIASYSDSTLLGYTLNSPGSPFIHVREPGGCQVMLRAVNGDNGQVGTVVNRDFDIIVNNAAVATFASGASFFKGSMVVYGPGADNHIGVNGITDSGNVPIGSISFRQTSVTAGGDEIAQVQAATGSDANVGELRFLVKQVDSHGLPTLVGKFDQNGSLRVNGQIHAAEFFTDGAGGNYTIKRRDTNANAWQMLSQDGNFWLWNYTNSTAAFYVEDTTHNVNFRTNVSVAGKIKNVGMPAAADDSAAAAAGVQVGEMYHASGVVRIRLS